MSADDPARAPAPPGDCATISILVKTTCADAFDVFTREIDLWWKQGPAYRRMIGLWWGALMTSLREHVAEHDARRASRGAMDLP